MSRLFHISFLLFIQMFFIGLESQTRHENSNADTISYSAKDKPDPFQNFFDCDEPFSLSLKFDMKTFQRTSAMEKYQAAVLTCQLNDSLQQSYKVKLKTRGTFRKSYCSVPPFWLNINNSGIESEAFSDQNKMKVVTHCMNKKEYQDYVLKEYLVYKLYGIISPYSFRVRLLRITFIDSGRNNKQSEAWAFAIEPEEMMAARLDATLVKNTRLSIRNMNPRMMDKLALFDYMIGNTDYSIPGLHNIKLIELNKPGEPGFIPVPYDFDFTGFVNAVYATPANNTRISDVTSRYYTGICRSDYIFENLVDDFNQYRDDFHCLLQPFEYMGLKQKLEMLRYIENYFDEAAGDGFIEWKLRNSCQ